MPKTREIRGRIRAVGNIQRITKTMQMIATARFQAAQKQAVATQPFTKKIGEMVGELSAALSGEDEGGVSHVLLREVSPKVGKKLVLVLTSNRGLCGGYNSNVLRQAMGVLGSAEGEVDLHVVGKKGMGFFKFNGKKVDQFHGQITDKPAYEQVEAIARQYMEAFVGGKYDSVSVVYMNFVSMSKQLPAVLQLLPIRRVEGEKGKGKKAGEGTGAGKSGGISGGTGGGAGVQYDFYPDAKGLLDELLPMTVKTQLFQCFNEAVVSEQISRMVAMKAATDAAGKQKKQLSRKYNRARQTAITTELMEVIAGAAGVS